MFSNINNVFQPINTCLVTVADKQGIHLKMHEMAILETLKFKKVYVLGGGGGGHAPRSPKKLAPSALIQTNMISIWDSQTWGL